jgi:hypothetical protein
MKEFFLKGSNTQEEHHCHYLSPRGILKSCSLYNQFPKSSNPDPEIHHYNKDILKILKKEDNLDDAIATIYVCNSALLYFVNHYASKIPYPYILVSGDSIQTIHRHLFGTESLMTFLHHENLVHWYCQNCALQHPKITKLPLGVDYHTLSSEHPKDWGPQMSPVDQEEQLVQIQKQSKPFWERQIKCYRNFQTDVPDFYQYSQDRMDAVQQIPQDLVWSESNKVERKDTWKHQTEYAFVLSPHGNGMDCHRTWEALILGCIPIVKTSSIDSLYDDLPVLIVNSWSDISSTLLEYTVQTFSREQSKFNYDKLALSYWTEKINSHSHSPTINHHRGDHATGFPMP